MKRYLFYYLSLLTLLILSSATIMAEDNIPAFPGAEGHGRYVVGGRKGTVYHVTTLSDNEKDGSGTSGSLRYCLKKGGSNAKTIVFDVAGVIPLTSDLKIPANTTIAGQTAPYPGITLRYYTVLPNGNEIIIRFIRFRRGEEKNVNDGADATWTRQKTNIILDHCSFSWSIDEVASFYDNNNFTMQWCTVGESLNNAGHDKGAHGYGGIWGGKLASFHHNLICHVNNRSPRFNGARYNWSGYTGNKLYSTYQWSNTLQAENVDFRNCVIYNCGNGCYGGPGGGQINVINNYYKTGPAASTNYITNVSLAGSGNAGNDQTFWDMTSRYYIDGNQMNNETGNDWSRIIYDNGIPSKNGEYYTKDPNHYYGSDVTYEQINGTDCVRIRMESPAPSGLVTTHTAQTAFQKVLAYGGASLDRDVVDARYMEEAENGTATYTGSVTGKKGRIDRVADVEGYTENDFPTGSRPTGFDTDGDGMPDEWETAHGLNPNNAADGKTYTLDAEKKWYTNLEVYLNALVEDIMKAGNSDALECVDEYYPVLSQSTGIIYPTPDASTVGLSYYNLKGQRISKPQHGTYIITEHKADGTTRCRKMVR